MKWLGLGKVAQLRIALGQLSLAVSPIVGRQPEQAHCSVIAFTSCCLRESEGRTSICKDDLLQRLCFEGFV